MRFISKLRLSYGNTSPLDSAPRALDLLKDRRPALISTEIPSKIDVSQATPILDA